ncbi:free fatty acid receptor 3-like [Aplysia californica]|uniref:Free fatty acid receptor 3-like n=1 Tax=Aplysia californica TaxID=6500 RepID=A0ABM0JDS3_APLCA|nr:free fatty acid receptor 3-like [Aplysia californica]
MAQIPKYVSNASAVDITTILSPITMEFVKTSTEPPFSGIVSYDVREIIGTINFVFLCGIISLFGIVANIINIIVFTMQGFAEDINISLLSLAISDLGSLMHLQWFSICLNPWFAQSGIPFRPSEIQSLTAGFPHICFTRITGWITAFVAFERCLCIAIPLKVKSIITRKLVITVNVMVFVIMFLSMIPVYTTAYYDWKFYPDVNRTLLGILYTANKKEVLGISIFFTDFAGPFSSFAIVIVSTVIIRIKLRQKATWRQTASNSAANSSSGELPKKERKVVAMVTTISIIFIICFTPVSLLHSAEAIEPEFDIIGKYKNLNWILYSFGFLLEAFNSSINIFVYFRMSSKYQEAFRRLFKIKVKA